MTTPVSAAAMRMKETLIRNPSLIEEGMQILDTDLPVLDEPPLDIFALDAQGVICVIVVRDGIEGERRDGAQGNILDDAKFYWHWITTFRDQFLPAAKKLSGRRVMLTVPRIIIISQGFSKALVQLASSAGEFTPITFLEMDPASPESGSTVVEIPEPSASEMATRKFEQYQSDRAAALDERNKGFLDNSKSVAYTLATVETLVEEIPEDRRADATALIGALGDMEGVRVSARKNRVICTTPSGHRAAEVVIGPGGGFSTTVYRYDADSASGTKKVDQFAPEDTKGAVDALKQAMATYPA